MVTVRVAMAKIRELMCRRISLLDSWREARVSNLAIKELLRKEQRRNRMLLKWGKERWNERRNTSARGKMSRRGRNQRVVAHCNKEAEWGDESDRPDLRVIVDTGFNGFLYINEATANSIVKLFARENIRLRWSKVNIKVQETSMQQVIQWKLHVPVTFDGEVFVIGALLHPGRDSADGGETEEHREVNDSPNLMGIRALRKMKLKVACGKRNTIEVEGKPDTLVDFGANLVPRFDFVTPILKSSGMIEAVRKTVSGGNDSNVDDDSSTGEEIVNMGKELNQRIKCLRERGETTRNELKVRKIRENREAPTKGKVFLRHSDKENFSSINGEGKESGRFSHRQETDCVAIPVPEKKSKTNLEKSSESKIRKEVTNLQSNKSKDIVAEFEKNRGNRNRSSTGRYGALESLRLRKYSRRELLLLDTAQGIHKQLGFCGERLLAEKLQQLWLCKDRYFANEAAKIVHATSVEGVAPMGRAVAPRIMSFYSKGLGEWGACDVFFIGNKVEEEQETRRDELEEAVRNRVELPSSSTDGPRYNVEKIRQNTRDRKVVTEEKSGVYLMIINIYSRHCGVFPLRDEKGQKVGAPDGGAVRRAILQYAGLNILPRNMLSDNGTEFRNRKVIEMAQACGVQWHFSASSSARSNGISERRIHAIKLIVLRLSKQNSKYNLDETVQQAASCINATPSSILGGWSPNNIQYGTPIDPQFSHSSIDNIENNTDITSSRKTKEATQQQGTNKGCHRASNELHDIAQQAETRLASRFWFREAYHQVSKNHAEMSIVRRKLDELKARYASSRGYRVGDIVWVRGKNNITPNDDAVEGVISGICNRSYNTVYYIMSRLSGVTLKSSAKEISLDMAENLDWEMPTQLTRVRQGANVSSLFRQVTNSSKTATGSDKNEGEVPIEDADGWVTFNMFPDHPKENALGVIIEDQVGSTSERTNSETTGQSSNEAKGEEEYELQIGGTSQGAQWDFQNANDSNQGRHGRGSADAAESHWVRCDSRGKFRVIDLTSYNMLKRARRYHIQCSDLSQGECQLPDDHLCHSVHPRTVSTEAAARIQVSNREYRKEKRRPVKEKQDDRERTTQRKYGKNRDENRVVWTPKQKKAMQAMINQVAHEAAIGEMKIKKHELLLMGDALRKLGSCTAVDRNNQKEIFDSLRRLFVGIFHIDYIVIVNGRNRIIEVPGDHSGKFCMHLHVATNKNIVETCASKRHKPINTVQVTVVYRNGMMEQEVKDKKTVGKLGNTLSGEQFYVGNYPLPTDVDYELKRNGKAAAVAYKKLARIGLLEQLVQATKTEFTKLTKPRESDGAVVLQKMSRSEADSYRKEHNSTRQVIPSQMLYDLKLENFPVNQSLCTIKARLVPIGWREDESDARISGVSDDGKLISDGHSANDGQIECNPFSSPTLSTTQLRIVMQIYASLPRGVCFGLDIRRAFLQSAPYPKSDVRWVDAPYNVKGDNRLKEEVGYNSGDTYLCSIPLYGLKSASVSWYKTLSSFLDAVGFVSSQECPSIFTLTAKNSKKLRAAADLINRGEKIECNDNPYSQLKRIRKNEVVEEIRNEIGEVRTEMGKNNVEHHPVDSDIGDGISKAFLPGGTNANHKLRNDDGERIVITLATHVDDVLGVCTCDAVMKVFVEVLGSMFAHGEVSILKNKSPINYCGKLLSQDDSGVLISCPNKASAIQTIKNDPSLFLENGLLNKDGIKRYRAVKGMLRFIGQCRPDSAYAIFLISQGSDECRGKDDIRRINKVVRFINQHPHLGHRIAWSDHVFSEKDNTCDWAGVRRSFHLVVMSDAALCVSDSTTVGKMNRDDKLKTVSGYICGTVPSCGDGAHPFGSNPNEGLNVRMGLIDANCVSMALTTSSSYAAEARSLRNNLCRTQVIKAEFLANKVNIESIFVFTDSSSIATRLASGESSLKIADANCYRDVIFIKAMITNRCFQLNFINDQNNMSDLLTKYHPESNIKYQKYLKLVNSGEWGIEAQSRCGKTSNQA